MFLLFGWGGWGGVGGEGVGDKSVRFTLRPRPKAQNTGIYSDFASLHNMLHKNNVEQDTLLQASMPVATMPKTLVFTTLLLLCNILRKDVEQSTLS